MWLTEVTHVSTLVELYQSRYTCRVISCMSDISWGIPYYKGNSTLPCTLYACKAMHFIVCTLGHLSSHGRPAMTSTASAPPTPTRTPPRPPETKDVMTILKLKVIKINDIFYTRIISSKPRGSHWPQCLLRSNDWPYLQKEEPLQWISLGLELFTSCSVAEVLHVLAISLILIHYDIGLITSIGGVAVSTNQHEARVGIVLQNDLKKKQQKLMRDYLAGFISGGPGGASLPPPPHTHTHIGFTYIKWGCPSHFGTGAVCPLLSEILKYKPSSMHYRLKIQGDAIVTYENLLPDVWFHCQVSRSRLHTWRQRRRESHRPPCLSPWPSWGHRWLQTGPLSGGHSES